MPTITVRNIPVEVYEGLKRSANANHRSINGEIIVCIEQATGYRTVDPQATIANARQLREKTLEHRVTDDEFTQAKEAGRP
jgi:plasmid stability protein